MSDEKKPNSKVVEANINARLNELKNVSRIVSNGINVIVDTDIKGGHAAPVAEFINWLTGFNSSVVNQIKTLEATLPKPEEKKVIEPSKTVTPESPKVVEEKLKSPIAPAKV